MALLSSGCELFLLCFSYNIMLRGRTSSSLQNVTYRFNRDDEELEELLTEGKI